jgi:hypothetical protein
MIYISLSLIWLGHSGAPTKRESSLMSFSNSLYSSTKWNFFLDGAHITKESTILGWWIWLSRLGLWEFRFQLEWNSDWVLTYYIEAMSFTPEQMFLWASLSVEFYG